MPTPQPLSESTFHILAALAEPRHGYAIMQWVAETSGGRVKLGPGTLYGALQTLQERGLISPYGERLEEAERRKLYMLTGEGLEALKAETARLASTAALGRKVLEARA